MFARHEQFVCTLQKNRLSSWKSAFKISWWNKSLAINLICALKVKVKANRNRTANTNRKLISIDGCHQIERKIRCSFSPRIVMLYVALILSVNFVLVSVALYFWPSINCARNKLIWAYFSICWLARAQFFDSMKSSFFSASRRTNQFRIQVVS